VGLDRKRASTTHSAIMAFLEIAINQVPGFAEPGVAVVTSQFTNIREHECGIEKLGDRLA